MTTQVVGRVVVLYSVHLAAVLLSAGQGVPKVLFQTLDEGGGDTGLTRRIVDETNDIQLDSWYIARSFGISENIIFHERSEVAGSVLPACVL